MIDALAVALLYIATILYFCALAVLYIVGGVARVAPLGLGLAAATTSVWYPGRRTGIVRLAGLIIVCVAFHRWHDGLHASPWDETGSDIWDASPLDVVAVINCPHRTERRVDAEAQIRRMNIPSSMVWWYSANCTRQAGYCGLYHSWKNLLEQLEAAGHEWALILEDDFQLLHGWQKALKDAAMVMKDSDVNRTGESHTVISLGGVAFFTSETHTGQLHHGHFALAEAMVVPTRLHRLFSASEVEMTCKTTMMDTWLNNQTQVLVSVPAAVSQSDKAVSSDNAAWSGFGPNLVRLSSRHLSISWAVVSTHSWRPFWLMCKAQLPMRWVLAVSHALL